MSVELPDSLGFKLLHVGVAVPSLDPTTQLLSNLFGYRVVSAPFDDPIQKVTVNFLATSDKDVAEIELIAPTSAASLVGVRFRSRLGQSSRTPGLRWRRASGPPT